MRSLGRSTTKRENTLESRLSGGSTVEQEINQYLQRFIPEAQYLEVAEHDTVTLPFSAIKRFGQFFAALETQIETFPFVKQGFNVIITSLEDEFLKVGQDQSVAHHLVLSEEDTKNNVVGIGSDRNYEPTFLSQRIHLRYLKVRLAMKTKRYSKLTAKTKLD